MICLRLLAQTISPNEVKLPNSDVTASTFETILQIVFGVAGAIALIVIVLAGFKYVLSRGNAQETAKAKNAILYAVIGLVVSLLSFTIVSFVITRFG